MKKHRKLLIFLTLVLLAAGYYWQAPSERNTVAILVRRQSQMVDFVQSVKAEAAHPHDVLSGPDSLWHTTPEDCADIYRAYLDGSPAPGAFTRGLYYRGVD